MNAQTKKGLETFYKVAIIAAQEAKKKSSSLGRGSKKMTGLVMFALALMMVGLVAAILYLIFCHQITPLMIYVSCLLPILAYGIARDQKTIQSLSKEYHDYSVAVQALIEAIRKGNTDLTQSIEQTMKEGADLDTIFGMIDTDDIDNDLVEKATGSGQESGLLIKEASTKKEAAETPSSDDVSEPDTSNLVNEQPSHIILDEDDDADFVI